MRTRWRRGTYSWIFGLTSFALLGFGAIGIDWFRVRVADTQAQNVADAAALAALVEFRYTGNTGDAETAADTIAELNYIAEQQGGMDLSYDWGKWEWGSPRDSAWVSGQAPYNGVRVTTSRTEDAASGEVQLWLAPALGYPTSEVWGTGTAAMRYREIMLVLDVTGSFRNEWGDAKVAVETFLDTIEETAMPGDKIGLVTFVADAEVHTPLQLLLGNYPSISSDWNALSTCHCWDEMFDNFYQYMSISLDGGVTYAPLDRATFDMQLGNDTGDPPTMMDCYVDDPDGDWYHEPTETWLSGAQPHYKESGTSQGHGLEMAIEELRSSDDEWATKVIVIVSDGRPQCTGEGDECDTARAEFGLEMAEEAWDPDDEDEAKIAIFSVSFNDPFDEDQSEYMEQLAQGWGEFYETPDSSELEDLLRYIAEQIPTAVVN